MMQDCLSRLSHYLVFVKNNRMTTSFNRIATVLEDCLTCPAAAVGSSVDALMAGMSSVVPINRNERQ